MLGKLMDWHRWAWVAFGKHPAARDYFQISLKSSLALAFSQWVENGFGRLAEEARRKGIYSWRFWSRGMKKSTLVCGLAKSSGDGVGRAYPLVLLGEGHLDRWPQHWNMLPFVLAPLWAKMEYVAARRLDHISLLAEELQRMETPKASWKEVPTALSRDPSTSEAQSMNRIVMDALREHTNDLETEQKLIIRMENGRDQDPLQFAGACHLAFRQHFTTPPCTVFMGGSLQRSYIVFFNRPLVADDFVDLWTV